MSDRYTKLALTVIAIALSVIAVRGTFVGPAIALGDGCGDRAAFACYVRIVE